MNKTMTAAIDLVCDAAEAADTELSVTGVARTDGKAVDLGADRLTTGGDTVRLVEDDTAVKLVHFDSNGCIKAEATFTHMPAAAIAAAAAHCLNFA